MKRDVKALVVDDSAPILSLMETILNEYGVLEVTKAANGLQALDYFSVALQNKKPYSLVLLDIVMPLMNGQEALKQMRDLERDAGLTGDDRATIIMVTSLHSTADMVAALIEGDCSDYLVKPFDLNDLLGVLKKHSCLGN